MSGRLLERFTTPSGLAGYRSPLLVEHGVPHAFTTRHVPDAGRLDDALVRALEELIGLSCLRPRVLRQVHGACVVESPASGDDRSREGSRERHSDRSPVAAAGAPPEADALVGERPDELYLVRVADCVPVLFAEPGGRRVAAAHAGWRGIVAGILPAVAERFAARGFVAAVGPCLSAARFEVGPEVAEAFVAAGLAQAVRPGRPRPFVDLRQACALQLRSAGALALDGTDRCTYAHAEDFWSHRRDVTHGGAPGTGRMAAVVATAR